MDCSIDTPRQEPTRDAALRALADFVGRLPDYRRHRLSLGAASAVSGLSPWIRYGLLPEVELGRAAHAVAPAHAAAFVEQVGWRVYFKGYLEQYPEIWRQWRQSALDAPVPLASARAELLARAEAGTTGLEPFDQWSRALCAHGWLSNRIRLWHAGIWVHTLGLPWELGAAFYLRHLRDGDPAANTLSWRWVAGYHTPGKAYLPQAEAIWRASDGVWDLRGKLIEERVGDLPQLPATGFQPLDLLADPAAAQQPALSQAPAGLLVTPEDLLPESGPLARGAFASVAVLAGADVWDGMRLAPQVRQWVAGLMEDTALRAAAHWDSEVVAAAAEPATPVPSRGPAANLSLCCRPRVHQGVVPHWTRGVLAWARRERLRCVRLYRPPVGPWRDQMPRLRLALQREGVELIEHRRPDDQLLWPLAQRGYFDFRQPWLEHCGAAARGCAATAFPHRAAPSDGALRASG